MRNFFLFIFFVFSLHEVPGQGIGSFYLDSLAAISSNHAAFSNDAIYFYNDRFLTKTDYNGNVLWSKQSIFSRIIVDGASMYALSTDSVIKMDTSGNVIWVKKFSAFIYPLFATSNIFNDIVFDGSRIYLQEMQLPPVPFPYPMNQDFHPAIIVLDTLGNVLSANCDSVYNVSGSYGQGPCVGSLRGGAIISDGFVGGNYFYSHLKRIDTNGNVDNSASFPNIYFGAQNYIHNILALPDSTYLILSNSDVFQLNNVAGFFTCSKVTESGNIIWEYSYYDVSVQYPDYGATEAFGITSDSLNNIYIMGTALGYASTRRFNGIFAIKLDSLGNVLFTNLWKNFPSQVQFYDSYLHVPDGFSNIHYANGNLYCLANFDTLAGECNPAIIVLSNLLTNSCYPPDSIISLSNAFAGSGNPPSSNIAPIISYLPTNDALTLGIKSMNNLDLCLALNTPNNSQKDDSFSLYPNPATSAFTIIATDEILNSQIEIYNLLGELIFSVFLNHENMTINCERFPKGIYFVKLQSKAASEVQKLIIE